MSKKNKVKKFKISKNLREMRAIAITITKKPNIYLRYSTKANTAFYEPEKLRITLTSNCLPKGIDKYPTIHRKLLDGLLGHECGHDVLTLPIYARYKRFEERVKFRGLAHFITNIIEDKRVNYFIEKRYRFDIGKRLTFLNRIEKETSEKAIAEQLKTKKAKTTVIGQGKLILGVLVNKGLYDVNTKYLEAKMEQKTKKDAKKCLRLLETTKYLKVKHDIIKVARQLYDTIEPYVENEEKLGQFIPQIIEGGELEAEISEELQDEFKNEEEREKEAKKQKEDLKRGGGAGKGMGEHIPSPEPDFEAYQNLVNECSEEITRLLNKLKRTVKPIVKKQQFRKRGRMMSPILAKAYTNSLRHRVQNIYVSTETKFEKQKVAIQVLVDFSGSMDKHTADKTITILNEVFGQWLEDKAFSILVFGEDYQKIKTFFETFSQTRARIGGISVDASATECSEPLEEILKMFNEIGDKEVSERDKLLVLASDFWFGDKEDTVEQLKELLKHGVKLLFVGLCNYAKIKEILPNTMGIFRTTIDDLGDLPELFIDIYQSAISHTD